MTLTLGWIAARLLRGAPAQVAHQLDRQAQWMATCENNLF
jgi:hypothetical protein